LPGAEQLAREVFQFWVDGGIREEQIDGWATCVRREFNA
jgi:hypothetical protein